MARPNRGRMIGTERALARRLRWEREQRGMTYDGLAARMTLAGCPIQGSALYKIEKGEPRRRITVDELVALGAVLELDVPDLLRPLEAVLHSDIADAAMAERKARDELYACVERVREARTRHLALYRRAHEDEADDLALAIVDWEDEHGALTVDAVATGAVLGEAERERPATESRRDRLIADAMTGLINAVYMVSAADAAGPPDEKVEG